MRIKKFFDIIKDGKWHQTHKLATQLEISTKKLTELLELFEENGIIIYDKKANRMKIHPEWKPLLPIEEA